MRNSICIAYALLITLLICGGCSSSSEELLLGRWETLSGDRSMEFRGDGTITMIKNGKPAWGRYQLQPRDRLVLTYTYDRLDWIEGFFIKVSPDELVVKERDHAVIYERVPAIGLNAPSPIDTADMARIFDEVTARAEAGDAYYQAVLAGMNNRGYGDFVGRLGDSKTARKWAELSANQGHPMGIFNVGYAISGPYVSREARELFERSFDGLMELAEQGDQYAQCCLGDMYRRGFGTARDDRMAYDWYRKAAEQGDIYAEYLMGYFYDQGRGVRPDKEQAAYWYRRAADKGDRHARDKYQFCLADLRKS